MLTSMFSAPSIASLNLEALMPVVLALIVLVTAAYTIGVCTGSAVEAWIASKAKAVATKIDPPKV